MSKGAVVILWMCILASVISFAQSDTLIRKSNKQNSFSQDIFSTKGSLKTSYSNEVNFGLLAMENATSTF